MRYLVTHPGKFGDLLWALPTARAIAEAAGEPVDIMVPGYLRDIDPLLRAQAYVGRVWVLDTWITQDTAPRSPWQAPAIEVATGMEARLWDRVVQLGYRRWPEQQLASEAYFNARNEVAAWGGFLPELDLSRPWIQPPMNTEVRMRMVRRSDVIVGFTDEYAEAKAGLLAALRHASLWEEEIYGPVGIRLLAPPGGSRLLHEWDWHWDLSVVEWSKVDWWEAAQDIAAAGVFVGCLSSLAVLAAGLGKPRVLVEPNPHRHHPIFQHPDQPLLTGGDGKPTFDARHLVDEVRGRLAQCR